MCLIGLDSTAAELHWFDRILSQGELGVDQLSRLSLLMDDPSISALLKVVYLHHHPFDFKPGMRLKDSDDLKPIIENRIDMVLFGPYHADPSSPGKAYHGNRGIRRCYNAGSSTHKNNSVGFHRVIDLEFDDPSMDLTEPLYMISQYIYESCEGVNYSLRVIHVLYSYQISA